MDNTTRCIYEYCWSVNLFRETHVVKTYRLATHSIPYSVARAVTNSTHLFPHTRIHILPTPSITFFAL